IGALRGIEERRLAAHTALRQRQVLTGIVAAEVEVIALFALAGLDTVLQLGACIERHGHVEAGAYVGVTREAILRLEGIEQIERWILKTRIEIQRGLLGIAIVPGERHIDPAAAVDNVDPVSVVLLRTRPEHLGSDSRTI